MTLHLPAPVYKWHDLCFAPGSRRRPPGWNVSVLVDQNISLCLGLSYTRKVIKVTENEAFEKLLQKVKQFRNSFTGHKLILIIHWWKRDESLRRRADKWKRFFCNSTTDRSKAPLALFLKNPFFQKNTCTCLDTNSYKSALSWRFVCVCVCVCVCATFIPLGIQQLKYLTLV